MNKKSFPPKFDVLVLGAGGKTMKGRMESGEWLEIDLTDENWLQMTTDDPFLIVIQAWVKYWQDQKLR